MRHRDSLPILMVGFNLWGCRELPFHTPDEDRCNRHEDCAKADRSATRAGFYSDEHCHGICGQRNMDGTPACVSAAERIPHSALVYLSRRREPDRGAA